MTKELSALLDGELEAHEAQALWADLKSDRKRFDTWRDYQLIRDAVRQEGPLGIDLTARVMRDLETEPVVLAPRRRAGRERRQSTLLAVAASLAGVAVVGWLALVQQPATPELPQLARGPEQVVRPVSVTTSQMPEYREYLLAHQTNAPGLHMMGGAQHIRTVAAVGSGQ